VVVVAVVSKLSIDDATPDREPRVVQRATCPTCNGSGQVEGLRAEWIRTGEEMRLDREQRGVTLQDEARARDLPAFLLVQMEQGLVRPLVREELGL
jgi:hypothetical protein